MKTLVNISVFGLIPVPPAPDVDPVRVVEEDKALTNGVQGPLERGLAMGTTSHGQGTARSLQEGEEAGAFAGLGMGLTTLAMAVLLPLLARLAL